MGESGFMLKKLVRQIFSLNAAELTVVTFLAASFLGAGVLYYTEQGRDVFEHKPEFVQVRIDSQDGHISSTDANYKFPIYQQHVFTKTVEQKGITFVDAWFTSVSALCVTGLTSTDFSQFTLAGQIAVMVLIQMGGLGIIVFTSFFALAVFRGVSERLEFRDLLSSVLDTNHDSVKLMLRHVFAYTFFIEFTGFLIMGARLSMLQDKSALDGTNPWWWALFHSVSAFNNAGFSLDAANLMDYVKDPVINLTISGLIILGGIGYPVLMAMYYWIKTRLFDQTKKQLADIKGEIDAVASPVQIKVALIGTFMLLFFGTIGIFVVENNAGIFEGYTIPEKIMISFFHSTSTRTAGFNTIDVGGLHIVTLLLLSGLMFVGANPAGTAGGIKIPTVAVLYGYIKDWFKAPRQPVMLLGNKISKFAVSHAIRLFFFSIVFITIVILMITYFERDYLITPDPLFNFQKVMFETISAFGTVGLSMGYAGGVTSFSGILSDPSKIAIIVTMLFGRIGPLNMLSALPWKRTHANAELSEDFEGAEKIQIG